MIRRNDYPIIDSSGRGYVDENGVKYDVYTFTRTEPLKARRDDRVERLELRRHCG